jgi:RNA polymerase sigma factor (sigma-70 family)
MDTNVDRAFTLFRARGADEDLVALLDACRPRAVGLCLRVLGRREDAEDAAQHVLLEIAEHAAGIHDAACFRSWFFRVCRTRSMDLQRRRFRRENHEARAPAPSPEPGLAERTDEARTILFRAIADLPADDRALVQGHYFESVSLGDLARERGCSKVAIWKRLGRIRATLLLKSLSQ